MLCFFVAESHKKTPKNPKNKHDAGAGVAVAVMWTWTGPKELLGCTSGKATTKDKRSLRRSFVPFPSSSSSPLPLMLCAGSDQHTPFWCAANFLSTVVFPQARDSCISFSACGYRCSKIQDPLPHFLLLGMVSHKCCKHHSS